MKFLKRVVGNIRDSITWLLVGIGMTVFFGLLTIIGTISTLLGMDNSDLAKYPKMPKYAIVDN